MITRRGFMQGLLAVGVALTFPRSQANCNTPDSVVYGKADHDFRGGCLYMLQWRGVKNPYRLYDGEEYKNAVVMVFCSQGIKKGQAILWERDGTVMPANNT